MKALSLRTAKRFLRSPAVIIGEIAAMALASVLGATLPQTGTASTAELARLHDSGTMWGGLVSFLALDHVFRSVWFLGLILLAAASLSIVVLAQLRRLRVSWSQRPSEAFFQTAPFRAEFERLVRTAPKSGAKPSLRMWTENRLGLTGSLVLHAGLLLVIVAGALRALFAVDAAVDVIEGETLAPTPRAWAAQWPGVMAKPFGLESPVTLQAVQASYYQTGELRALKATLALPGTPTAQQSEIALNHDTRLAGRPLFLSSQFGPAALVEWLDKGAPPLRQVALLTSCGKGTFERSLAGPSGLVAHLRAQVAPDGNHPAHVEVRVMKDGALLLTTDARVGEILSLRGGQQLVLRGTPFWVRLHGSHDPALWLAYAGFMLVILGATLIFTLVKVDGCVKVVPLGERERVFIALKPQRFAGLFEERFHQLLREEGTSVLSHTLSTFDMPPGLGVAQSSGACDHSLLPLPLAKPQRTATLQDAPALSSLACWPLLLLSPLLFTSCQPASFDHARQLVQRYNDVVSEAYRRGDVKLIGPVVGPNEGRKLTGLIGVRLDLGLTLDSQLLALEVTRVERERDEMRVWTKERWRYRDRKIGTGEQVGEESLDSYEMLYLFKRMDRVWLVDEIRFNAPPQVGRKRTPWIADRTQLHGRAASASPIEAQKP